MKILLTTLRNLFNNIYYNGFSLVITVFFRRVGGSSLKRCGLFQGPTPLLVPCFRFQRELKSKRRRVPIHMKLSLSFVYKVIFI